MSAQASRGQSPRAETTPKAADRPLLLSKGTTTELRDAATNLDAIAVRIELIADALRPSSERWYVLLVEYAGDLGRLLAEIERMADKHGWPEAMR